MDIFKEKIAKVFDEKKLDFGELDKEVILGNTLSSAEEFVLSKIASNHLSKENQSLFKDAYLSAPDIFDVDEFLSENIENYDLLVDKYFEEWLLNFKNNL